MSSAFRPGARYQHEQSGQYFTAVSDERGRLFARLDDGRVIPLGNLSTVGPVGTRQEVAPQGNAHPEAVTSPRTFDHLAVPPSTHRAGPTDPSTGSAYTHNSSRPPLEGAHSAFQQLQPGNINRNVHAQSANDRSRSLSYHSAQSHQLSPSLHHAVGSQDRAPAPGACSRQLMIHKPIRSTPGDAELLDPSYKKRSNPGKFFVLGKVFLVLWSEPARHTTNPSQPAPTEVTVGTLGERVHSKIRRFVVVRQGTDSCLALKICTYGGRGVGKPGVVKFEHAIIHSTRLPPQPLRQEWPIPGEGGGMLTPPIRVAPHEGGDPLDPVSRVDLGRTYTIEHYVKAKGYGVVADVNHLQKLWRLVTFRDDPVGGPTNIPTVPRPRPPPPPGGGYGTGGQPGTAGRSFGDARGFATPSAARSAAAATQLTAQQQAAVAQHRQARQDRYEAARLRDELSDDDGEGEEDSGDDDDDDDDGDDDDDDDHEGSEDEDASADEADSGPATPRGHH